MKHHRLRVQELGHAKGLNITTFGRRAALAPGSARAWWYGEVDRFDGDLLERVAEALDVSIGNLFERIPENDDSTQTQP